MGYPHPDYLLANLTSTQLSEWEAFNVLDPIGQVRDDYHFSFLASLITNIMITQFGERGAKLTSVDDFKFDWKKSEEDIEEDLSTQIKKVFGGMGKG